MTDDPTTATTHDLLERYMGLMDSARYLAADHPDQSRIARENAEAIAAEIERRCVR